jgi:hypothetical protein
MKTPISLLTLATVLTIASMGCSKSDSTASGSDAPSSAAPMAGLDLSSVESAFASASGTVKAEFNAITAYIKGGDYSAAMDKLKTLAASAELSPDQKSALSTLMEQVKTKGGELLKNVGQTAGKAVDQAKEAAGKVADQAGDAASKAATQATDAAKKATGNLLPK